MHNAAGGLRMNKQMQMHVRHAFGARANRRLPPRARRHRRRSPILPCTGGRLRGPGNARLPSGSAGRT
jgi:hypothetical protein